METLHDMYEGRNPQKDSIKRVKKEGYKELVKKNDDGSVEMLKKGDPKGFRLHGILHGKEPSDVIAIVQVDGNVEYVYR
jgi:hypothetical protein